MRGPAWAARDELVRAGLAKAADVTRWEEAFAALDAATERPELRPRPVRRSLPPTHLRGRCDETRPANGLRARSGRARPTPSRRSCATPTSPSPTNCHPTCCMPGSTACWTRRAPRRSWRTSTGSSLARPACTRRVLIRVGAAHRQRRRPGGRGRPRPPARGRRTGVDGGVRGACRSRRRHGAAPAHSPLHEGGGCAVQPWATDGTRRGTSTSAPASARPPAAAVAAYRLDLAPAAASSAAAGATRPAGPGVRRRDLGGVGRRARAVPALADDPAGRPGEGAPPRGARVGDLHHQREGRVLVGRGPRAPRRDGARRLRVHPGRRPAPADQPQAASRCSR